MQETDDNMTVSTLQQLVLAILQHHPGITFDALEAIAPQTPAPAPAPATVPATVPAPRPSSRSQPPLVHLWQVPRNGHRFRNSLLWPAQLHLATTCDYLTIIPFNIHILYLSHNSSMM